MKKLLKIAFAILLISILTISVFLYSPYGISLLTHLIKKYGGGVVTVEEVTGRLASNLHLRDIVVSTDAVDVKVSSTSLSWTISAVLMGQLRVSDIKVDGLTFVFKDSGEQPDVIEESDEPFTLALPKTLIPVFGVSVGELLVENISFQLEDGEEVENIDSLSFAGSVRGKGFSFSRLAVEDEDYAVILSGSGRAGEVWQANLRGDWRFSNWDGGELRGTLSASGPLPDMDVRVELITPAKVDIRGKMKDLPSNPFFEVTGKGEKSSLVAVHPSCPEIYLDAYAEASGYINNYQGWLTTTGDWGLYKGITGETRLRGNLDNIHFTSLVFKHAKSVVDIEGGYLDWLDAFIVGGKIHAQRYNPGVFDEFWQASLDGEVDGLLTVDDEVFGEYTLSNMSGTWHGYPVSGNAKVHFTDEDFIVDDVLVKNGQSTLGYQAAFTENLKMNIILDSPDFGELLPGAYGKLKADILMEGNYDSPVVSGDIVGSNIGYYGVSLDSLNVSVVENENENENGQFIANATGSGLGIYGQTFSDVVAKLQGDFNAHSGTLILQDKRHTIDSAFSGVFEGGTWTTKIEKFTLQDNVLGDWQLNNSPTLQVSEEFTELGKSCFTELQSTFCLSLLYENEKENDPYQISASFDKYSIDKFSVYEFVPDSLTGVLSGNLNIRGEVDRLVALQADFDLADAAMTVNIAGKEEAVLLQNTLASLSFDGEKALLDLGMVVKESNWLLRAETFWDGTFDVDLEDLPLGGKLHVDSFDVALLNNLFGYEVQPSGALTVDVALLGTFADPRGDGDVVLEDGSVNLPSLGIQLKQIELNFAGRKGEVDVKGRCSSGGGVTEVAGTLYRNDTWEISGLVTVDGRNFLLLNLPEYEVYVNPDLDIDFNFQGARISGNVFIPKAYIAPEEMIGSVQESADVVFVDDFTEEIESSYRLSTRIRLDLGENVSFHGYGLKGRLTGGLDVVGEPSRHLGGTGALVFVDSTFSTYGRTLDIARGKILFTGGSVSNPGVDVRAQRAVSDQVGSRGGYTVGVDISGLIPDLNYSLFSSPYMDDADILAYLILGHSLLDADDEDSNLLAGAASAFGWEEQANIMRKVASVLPVDDIHIESNMSEDDMSLVVGKSLTKNLYVGYDYSVRDQIGEVRLRYDLQYGFFVESRNSSESTGADLLYVIER